MTYTEVCGQSFINLIHLENMLICFLAELASQLTWLFLYMSKNEIQLSEL